MTRKSIHEYATVVRQRYQEANKKNKGAILNEFCRITGYHRKAAVRLLRQSAPRPKLRRGGSRKYGPAVALALKRLWDVSNHLCSKRLKPFIPELVSVLEHHGEIALEPEVRLKLGQVSPSTIDRLLKPYRLTLKRRPRAQSQSRAAGLYQGSDTSAYLWGVEA